VLNLSKPIDTVLNALAEPARRGIVERLAEGPSSVSSLAEGLPMSLPAVMQHLAVLQAANLIETKKVGRVRTVSLKSAPFKKLESWATAQRMRWERKLDHLGAYLEETKPTTDRDRT
jgi:DNA-binding transcriptional ArsR family regulator